MVVASLTGRHMAILAMVMDTAMITVATAANAYGQKNENTSTCDVDGCGDATQRMCRAIP